MQKSLTCLLPFLACLRTGSLNPIPYTVGKISGSKLSDRTAIAELHMRWTAASKLPKISHYLTGGY